VWERRSLLGGEEGPMEKAKKGRRRDSRMKEQKRGKGKERWRGLALVGGGGGGRALVIRARDSSNLL